MNIEELDISANHKLQINEARVRETGERIWWVSFATPCDHKPQQVGYYQTFHKKPNEHDIMVTYTNFLELIKRTV